jgi:hypothetical protein
MTKWKLVPVELWRELEPYLGKDVPDREVVLLSDVKGVLAAPQPQKLSDERILRHLDAILKASGSGLKNYSMHKIIEDMKQAVRAIEREILGGGHD